MATKFTLAAFAITAISAQTYDAAASSYNVLFTFNGKNGSIPADRLLLDSAGNIFGTTTYGGAHNQGTVFELSPPAGGQSVWKETVLYSFNGKDGQLPLAGLVEDTSGNLYGTTGSGGVSKYPNCGCGTVFKLAPPASAGAAWKETVLYAFGANPSLENPYASLTFDAAGRLYGTAATGGYGKGGVFRLVPSVTSKVGWEYESLYLFKAAGGSFDPVGNVVIDQSGNVYGTSRRGGPTSGCQNVGCGTVYEISPPASGSTKWTEKDLFDLIEKDGYDPLAGLVPGQDGNFYGTTYNGTGAGYGDVFQLTPPSTQGAKWSYTKLVALTKAKGGYPVGSLLPDSAGGFYLATNQYGPHDAGSIIFLTPPAQSQTSWQQNVVFGFSGLGPGQDAGLVMDKSGTLYGTTGGNAGTGGTVHGTVYKISP